MLMGEPADFDSGEFDFSMANLCGNCVDAFMFAMAEDDVVIQKTQTGYSLYRTSEELV
jgi:hypothetical protein